MSQDVAEVAVLDVSEVQENLFENSQMVSRRVSTERGDFHLIDELLFHCSVRQLLLHVNFIILRAAGLPIPPPVLQI